MKYIYILYSDKIRQAYFGSTSLNLNRRLQFHKNDNRRKFNLSCSNILDQDDFKIDKLFEFDNISKSQIEKLESQLIIQYKNNCFFFNNKVYKIVNISIPYVKERFLCPCGCENEITKNKIIKHLKINKKLIC